MILISSAAYIDNEFVSEVGLLPPSFLPIGNQRLYELQIDWLRKIHGDVDIYISLPRSFAVPTFDLKFLDEANIKTLFIEDGLSLGESILCAWNSAPQPFESLTVLYGDSLFESFPPEKSTVFGVHKNSGSYERAARCEKNNRYEVRRCVEGEQVLSGYFKFSNPFYLMRALVESNYDFIHSINNYCCNIDTAIFNCGDWLDFGHINAFFKSRTKITTERVFNELEINRRTVKKRSLTNSKKIEAESYWYKNLPSKLNGYTPSLLSSGLDELGTASYEIEYLYLMPLNDLYVFSELGHHRWLQIFSSLKELLYLFYQEKAPDDLSSELNNLYLEKTKQRLELFYSQQKEIKPNTKFYIRNFGELNLLEIAEHASSYIEIPCSELQTVSHGDFCFSNILFDSRSEKVICLDPRGQLSSGQLSIFGDIRYDIAKLYHSVIAGYDKIIANRYIVLENGDIDFGEDKKYENLLEDSFNEYFLEPFGVKQTEILAINVLLFLSMIPLHHDHEKRQKAFLANALVLFKKLMEI